MNFRLIIAYGMMRKQVNYRSLSASLTNENRFHYAEVSRASKKIVFLWIEIVTL